MATATKVLIGIGDEVIELTGAELEAFVADRQAIVDSQAQIEAEQTAKAAARASALAKLAELGLTAEEIAAL
jgi:hypothetical protein